MDAVVIRDANIKDLPSIHYLIRESYGAMSEHSPSQFHSVFNDAVEVVIENDLHSDNFHYFKTKNDMFWVAELDSEVVGCVAMKRVTADEGEIKRMAVSPTHRGKGIGQKLLQKLVKFASSTGVLRIHALTFNPSSSKFYIKNGFTLQATRMVDMRVGTKINLIYPYELPEYLHILYLGERIIRKVVIVGGTHGDELLGIEIVRQWQNNIDKPSYETLEIEYIIGNEEAVKVNRRYIHSDLNRQFASLDSISDTTTEYEPARALYLNKLLGPKGALNQEVPHCDFVIDLHSTCSNTGLVAMISGEQDMVAFRVAQHLSTQFVNLKVTASPGTKSDSYSVDSIAPYGIAFEIGPQSHSTLSYKHLTAAKQLIVSTLDYINNRNLELLATDQPASISFGKTYVLSSTSKSHEVIVPTLFPTLNVYYPVERILYPISNSIWREYVIHPNLEGNDWSPLVVGKSSVFISTTGTDTTVSLPPTEKLQMNEEVYPLFINEAAYQSSSVAFVVFRKIVKIII